MVSKSAQIICFVKDQAMLNYETKCLIQFVVSETNGIRSHIRSYVKTCSCDGDDI